ncbi:hypothetical protein N7G274_002353 [Stereocaulon virgatum]|uniref:Calponin-homology (CH) domain-containing protein n=1 Tax=Stereocaulon virgatum TaxID=373712 RepID=A0ABR4AJE3_9LECA
MASVSSLDKDMRNIRMSKYTPQAANEVRTWIEDVLGERLAPGDLLEALKDGTALCKLVNLAALPGVKFKESTMPFVQMENISHFLHACQSPPLNLQSHDIFQTVDLFEAKDPAQVLQCISAFSRRAHAVQPGKFSRAIGGSKIGLVSPQSTGGFSAGGTKYGRPRGASNTSETSSTPSYYASQAVGGRNSPSRLSESSTPKKAANGGLSSPAGGGVSSWSKRQDEGATTPAWNIHQYGYMGGASQGNQGIAFGARRQITTPGPKVPSLAEKERKRREQEAEAERLRQQAEEAEQRRRVEREAEEERERLAEEQRWEEETRRHREAERLRVAEEKRRWEEEERRWKQEEEARIVEEKETEARLERERQQKTGGHDAARPKLQGQYLSQYKAEQAQMPVRSREEDLERVAERERVRELERQLEEAKGRESQYERERQERLQADRSREQSVLEHHDFDIRQIEETKRDRSRSRSRPAQLHSHKSSDHSWQAMERDYLQKHQPHKHSSEDSWQAEERDYLRKQWAKNHPETHGTTDTLPQQPHRPLPTPQKSLPTPPEEPSPTPSPPPISSLPPRPPPNPANYVSSSPHPPSSPRKSPSARPDSSNPSTTPSQPTKPGSTPSKKPPFTNPSSLLSREMELDRLRQKEWEEAQKATKAAAADGGLPLEDGKAAWDVNQYGYLGGDSQNRGGTGIGFGGRRQLVGPREPPGK